jgi:hypothetical protein
MGLTPNETATTQKRSWDWYFYEMAKTLRKDKSDE